MSSKSIPVDKRRGRPTSVDGHVGLRLRQLRTLMGLSQEKLAANLGLTFQQVQKYERGSNRIGASRLYDLSRILSVPVSYFFEGLESGSTTSYSLAEERAVYGEMPDDVMNRKETMELVRIYYRIKDPTVRKKFLDLAKSMSDAPDSD